MIDDLIYDIGMNHGDDTGYYLHRGYRVVAVDVDPQVCENVRRRFQNEVDGGRLTVLHAGIAVQPGTRGFWLGAPCPEGEAGDQQGASPKESPHEKIEVPCRTFDSLFLQFGTPYYLKVNTEGHDLHCVDGLQAVCDRPKYISVEVTAMEESLRTMTILGYTAFKCISPFTFVPLEYPPTASQRRAEFWHRLLTRRDFPLRMARRAAGPAGRHWIGARYTRTRRRGDWVFHSGSSGPFGEDTLGTWLTADQVRDAYRHYQRLCDAGEPGIFWKATSHSFWVHLHARRDN